jgi:molecular chaperone GrpE
MSKQQTDPTVVKNTDMTQATDERSDASILEEEIVEVADTSPDPRNEFPVNATNNHSKANQNAEIASLKDQLVSEKQDKLRALADYQNLIRRTQAERQSMAQLATRALVEDLLEHFDHLSMAADHLKDPALQMIVGQLWQTLESHGLVEITALGKPFDPTCMEVVESAEISEKHDKDEVVRKVASRGYRLNGTVVRIAKVVL